MACHFCDQASSDRSLSRSQILSPRGSRALMGQAAVSERLTRQGTEGGLQPTVSQELRLSVQEPSGS